MLHITQGKHWQTHLYQTAPPTRIGSEAMGLYLSRMGRFQSDGHFELRQGTSTVSVHAIAEGAGQMVANGNAYAVGTGDLFVFFPGQDLHYFDRPDDPWKYTWFALEGRQAVPVLAHCGLTPNHPHRPAGATPRLEAIFRATEEALGHPTVSPLSTISLAWQLAREMEPKNTPQPHLTLVDQAQFLFDHSYGSPPTIEQLADQLRVSRTTLFRAFKRKFGHSPKEVLDERRIQRAMHLLRASTERIKEVAASCGYQSEAYFCRTFKARTGLPPGRWRRQWQSSGRASEKV